MRATLCLIALLCGSACAASDYFVSPQGDDSSPGTAPGAPLRWIQTAINKAGPGSTIRLLPGVHAVKPGDKNITFRAKNGTATAPITLTAAAAGVVIDLEKVERGYGGLRICDGSSWIVVDGGGKPDPMDESTYWMIFKNGGYGMATGADRSTVSCRAITCQDAANIVIRNVCGVRSMGTFGMFGAKTHHILVENCRCVPGTKAREDCVSHGIYVGTGADHVTIRNTFIKWGGDARLGLQNNGGGTHVTIEHSVITECCAAIKSFNGGEVTARDCYFWKNVESPMQGKVTAVNVLTSEPPSWFFRAGPPVTQVRPADPPPKPAEPAPVAQPPTPALPPIDPAPHRDALRAALQAFKGKAVSVSMKLFGRTERAEFAGGDASGPRVTIAGNSAPLRWKDVSDEDLLQLCTACCNDDATALFHASLLAAALKIDAQFEKLSQRLAEVNPELALEAGELLPKRK